MKLHPLFLALIILVFFTECKKKPDPVEDDQTCQENRKKILCSHRWKKVSVLVNGAEEIEECEKDDTLVFTSNWLNFTLEGPDKCYMNSTDTTDLYKYHFTKCNTIIMFADDITGILELNDSVFRLNASDIGYTAEIIYRRIE